MTIKKLMNPSRPDAEPLKRYEKMAFIHLMYAATILDELTKDIADRLNMVDDGVARLKHISELTDGLLDDLRVTAPENQRIHLQNTAEDYEIRLAPKATPSKQNVVSTKEEFRTLVDAARTKCMECTLDDDECSKCDLFRLLTSILPVDDYHDRMLCPYNIATWGN